MEAEESDLRKTSATPLQKATREYRTLIGGTIMATNLLLSHAERTKMSPNRIKLIKINAHVMLRHIEDIAISKGVQLSKRNSDNYNGVYYD